MNMRPNRQGSHIYLFLSQMQFLRWILLPTEHCSCANQITLAASAAQCNGGGSLRHRNFKASEYLLIIEPF